MKITLRSSVVFPKMTITFTKKLSNWRISLNIGERSLIISFKKSKKPLEGSASSGKVVNFYWLSKAAGFVIDLLRSWWYINYTYKNKIIKLWHSLIWIGIKWNVKVKLRIMLKRSVTAEKSLRIIKSKRVDKEESLSWLVSGSVECCALLKFIIWLLPITWRYREKMEYWEK